MVGKDGQEILYIHGTKMNESWSKKSARQLKKYYPKADIICCKGHAHCYKAIYEPKKWIELVENFLDD